MLKTKLLFCVLALALVIPAWCADADKLAGENEPSKPNQRQAMEGPEEQGPVSLTRSAKSAPSFKLPEMVITGEGEAKVLFQRSNLNLGLDTSGGLQSTPGEQEGGKDELAPSNKKILEGQSYSPKPSYGQLTGSYGQPQRYLLGLIYGRQEGDWNFLLQAQDQTIASAPVQLFSSDGSTLAAWQERFLQGQVGYQLDRDQRVQAEFNLNQRQQDTPFAGPAGSSLNRDKEEGNLIWLGNFSGLFDQNLQFQWVSAHLRPNGTSFGFNENTADLKGQWQKEWSWMGMRQLLSWDAEARWIGQDASSALPADSSSRGLAGLSLKDRFELLPGTSLSLGLRQQAWYGSNTSTFIFAPLGELDQRLRGDLSLFASFDPRLYLPLLSGDQYEKDFVLPNAALQPEKDLVRVKAGLRHQVREDFRVEVGAFYNQSDQSVVLDDPGLIHLWLPVNAGQVRVWGADLSQEAEIWSGVHESLHYRYQKAENLDDPTLNVTYSPEHQADFNLRKQAGAWEYQGGLEFISVRWVRQRGNEQAPAGLNLDAKVLYHYDQWLTVFLHGGNLLTQDYELWYGYPIARPSVDLGVTVLF